MAESSRSSSKSSDSEKQKASIDLHRQPSLSNSSVSTIIDSDFCPKEDNNNSLVIPANAEKLSDPERWKELPSTPSKPPLKGRFLVPDPSPVPTVSDTESMVTAPERCSPYVPRRGEHVQRPPVWKLYDQDLVRPPKLNRASIIASIKEKENAPLKNVKGKRTPIRKNRSQRPDRDWLKKKSSFDLMSLPIENQPPLIVRMMQHDGSPPLAHDSSETQPLDKQSQQPDPPMTAHAEGSPEANEGQTATPSASGTGINTPQGGTAGSQSPETEACETPHHECLAQDPPTSNQRPRRPTIDEALQNAGRSLNDWSRNLIQAGETHPTHEVPPENIRHDVVTDSQESHDEQHNPPELEHAPTVAASPHEATQSQDAASAPDQQQAETTDDERLAVRSEPEDFDNDIQIYQDYRAQSHIAQLSRELLHQEEEGVHLNVIDELALHAPLIGRSIDWQRNWDRIRFGNDPELDEEGRAEWNRDWPLREARIWLGFQANFFRRRGSQDLLAQRDAADEFVRYCNGWYIGVRARARARANETAVGETDAQADGEGETWTEAMRNTDPTDSQIVPVGDTDPAARQNVPFGPESRPTLLQRLRRPFYSLRRRQRRSLFDKSTSVDANPSEASYSRSFSSSFNKFIKGNTRSATEPAKKQTKRPRVRSSHFKEHLHRNRDDDRAAQDSAQMEATTPEALHQSLQQTRAVPSLGVSPPDTSPSAVPSKRLDKPLPEMPEQEQNEQNPAPLLGWRPSVPPEGVSHPLTALERERRGLQGLGQSTGSLGPFAASVGARSEPVANTSAPRPTSCSGATSSSIFNSQLRPRSRGQPDGKKKVSIGDAKVVGTSASVPVEEDEEDEEGCTPLKRTASRRPSNPFRDTPHPSDLPIFSEYSRSSPRGDRDATSTRIPSSEYSQEETLNVTSPSQPSEPPRTTTPNTQERPNTSEISEPQRPYTPSGRTVPILSQINAKPYKINRDEIVEIEPTPNCPPGQGGRARTGQQVLQSMANHDIRARKERERQRAALPPFNTDDGAPPVLQAQVQRDRSRLSVNEMGDMPTSDAAAAAKESPPGTGILSPPGGSVSLDLATSRDPLIESSDGKGKEKKTKKPWELSSGHSIFTKRLSSLVSKGDKDKDKNKENKQKKKFDGEGYDEEGYDKNGYNRKGYDREGYDRRGKDKDGYDREGRHGPYEGMGKRAGGW